MAANDLTLLVSQLPPGTFGYFVTSQAQSQPVPAAAYVGILCLGGSLGRFVAPGQILFSGAAPTGPHPPRFRWT